MTPVIIAHRTRSLFRPGGVYQQPGRLMYKLAAYSAGHEMGRMQAMGGVTVPDVSVS